MRIFLRRAAVWLAALAGVLLLACAAALQFYVFPHINDFRGRIAASLTQAAGVPVTIGRLSAGWNGVYPRIRIDGLEVRSGGQTVLHLDAVRASVSWWSLAVGDLRLHALDIDQPAIRIARDADGGLRVAGIRIDASRSAGGGFTDWLLAQRHVRVTGATLYWHDATGRTPDIALQHVNLALNSWASRHTFVLDAAPPAALAAPLHVTGKLYGHHTDDPDDWHGQLHVEVRAADLASLDRWLPASWPAVTTGHGSVTADLAFDRGRQLERLAADLGVQQLTVRQSSPAPDLAIAQLGGQLVWQRTSTGYSLDTGNLSMDAGPDLRFQSIGFHLRVDLGPDGHLTAGEWRAPRIPLGVVTATLHRLPSLATNLPGLAALAPGGELTDVLLRWQGWGNTFQATRAHACLAGVDFQPINGWPGVDGLSGTLDSQGQQGTFTFATRDARLSWPGFFEQDLAIGTLDGRLGWRLAPGSLSLHADRLTFANPDAAGQLQLQYDRSPGHPAALDLTGHLSHADGRRVAAYLPLSLGQPARAWVNAAIRAGTSDSVSFTVRGDPDRFPFAGDEGGVFDINAHVNGVDLRFAPAWPDLTHTDAQLDFHGTAMHVTAQGGTILGTRIVRVNATIPDLTAHRPHLLIDGQTAGSVQQALAFISHSPLSRHLYGLTDGVSSHGNGLLALKLDVPLANPDATVYAGDFRFQNDTLAAAGRWPVVSHLNGDLDFDNAGIHINNLSGTALGGPVHIHSHLVDGLPQILLQGQFAAGPLKAWLGEPQLSSLRGGASYTARIIWHRVMSDLIVDSDLRGLAIALPAPLNKAAVDAAPLHVELRSLSPVRDMISAVYDRQVFVRLDRHKVNGLNHLDGGVISFGEDDRQAAQSGLWLRGHLKSFDADRWRQVLAAGNSSAALPLAGARVSFDTLDLLGRRLGHVRLTAAPQGSGWRFDVASDELAGEFDWQPGGHGAVRANLRYFSIPAHAPDAGATDTASAGSGPLPALDITAASFRLHGKDLGRLHLLGRDAGGVWRIDDFSLANPDLTLKLNGTSPDDGAGRTNMAVDLVTPSAGKLLSGLGYPGNIRGGPTHLSGRIGWNGELTDFNLRSLSGQLSLQVGRGQFTRIEPGAGKLLGILSLQELPRRITLDFRDVFSQGFAFDGITATLNINNGVVSSNDFRMSGPAAAVAITGETQLANETQDLTVRIVPAIGDSVSVASAFLSGPVVGLTALVVQKLLKDPLGQIIAHEYSITGTWDNPVVGRVAATPDPTRKYHLK